MSIFMPSFLLPRWMRGSVSPKRDSAQRTRTRLVDPRFFPKVTNFLVNIPLDPLLLVLAAFDLVFCSASKLPGPSRLPQNERSTESNTPTAVPLCAMKNFVVRPEIARNDSSPWAEIRLHKVSFRQLAPASPPGSSLASVCTMVRQHWRISPEPGICGCDPSRR
jgi:hypothetical protein